MNLLPFLSFVKFDISHRSESSVLFTFILSFWFHGTSHYLCSPSFHTVSIFPSILVVLMLSSLPLQLFPWNSCIMPCQWSKPSTATAKMAKYSRWSANSLATSGLENTLLLFFSVWSSGMRSLGAASNAGETFWNSNCFWWGHKWRDWGIVLCENLLAVQLSQLSLREDWNLGVSSVCILNLKMTIKSQN